jgi:hypothetical protein
VSRLHKSILAAAALLVPGIGGSAQDLATSPPARNWTLPLFTKEGFREMTIRGDEVHPMSSDRIDIRGMNITVFSGHPDARVDSVLLSTECSFLITEKIARGDHTVRLVRDDIEVTGDVWSYNYNEKKVLISKRAHVVFHSALPDILK